MGLCARRVCFWWIAAIWQPEHNTEKRFGLVASPSPAQQRFKHHNRRMEIAGPRALGAVQFTELKVEALVHGVGARIGQYGPTNRIGRRYHSRGKVSAWRAYAIRRGLIQPWEFSVR